jgi:UDP-glucuronate 4-epimerase
MNILVTGCAGFIGSHLCEKLLYANNNVYGIDIMNDYYDINQKRNNLRILYKHINFKFRQDDIIYTDIIGEYHFDVVINLAAMAGVRYSIQQPELYMKTNVEGHTHLLQQCVEHNVKLYLYASSSSVYGSNEKVPFNENDALSNIISPYASSKRCCEIIANMYSQLYDIKTVGFRFFTVYGPRGRPDMFPYIILSKMIKNESFNKYGHGDTYRDYTYIDDIVDGIIKGISCNTHEKSEIYNLGNSDPVTINDFISICEDITKTKAIFNELPEQVGDVSKTFADINKARTELGYNPTTKLAVGLSKTFEWFKHSAQN